MGDAPDLQETIEALDATRKILMSGDGEWADAEEMDRRVTDALTLLKAQQWISVEDRLPKRVLDVLFVTWYDNRPQTWLGFLSKKDWWDCCQTDGNNMPIEVEVEYGPVTHWMPLPDPPPAPETDNE